MMTDVSRNMLMEQRRRLVGSVMEYVEKNIYKYLPEDERKKLREKMLASIGVYHDVMLDLVRALAGTDEAVVNEHALLLLQQIHAEVRSLRPASGE